jgi:hypothetical protein
MEYSPLFIGDDTENYEIHPYTQQNTSDLIQVSVFQDQRFSRHNV